MLKNSVLLMKSQVSTSKVKYKPFLESQGFQVHQVKTLDFVYKNLDVLRRKFLNSTTYAGVVFSSPRCVNAVEQAFEGTTIPSQLWKDKCNYVVGETTREIALEKLYLQCRGHNSGNAANLAQIIINDGVKTEPFLFPCGNLSQSVLGQKLQENGFTGLDTIVCYDSVASPTIEADLQSITNDFTTIPEFVVFFSPSGVSSMSFLKRVNVDWTLIKLVAIGAVTEQKMKEDSLQVFAVAKKPTPEDLFEALKSN